MTLRALMEKRAKIVGRMRHLNDAPAGEAGDLSEPQAKEFAELRADLAKTDAAIGRQTLIDEADRRASGVTLDEGSGDRQMQERRANFQRHRINRQIAIDCGFEREDGLEAENRTELRRLYPSLKNPVPIEALSVERRTLTTTTPNGGPGSNLAGEDFRPNEYVHLLDAYNPLFELGVRRMTVNGATLVIPGGKAPAVAAFTGENQTIGATDPQFRQITASQKHCTALTEVSRNLLNSSNAEPLVRDLLAKAAAQKVAAVALKGGGANEPVGVLATSGLPTVSLATPSYDAVLDMEATLAEKNAQGTGWVMRPIAAKRLRKTPKIASTDSVMVMQDASTLLGYPVARTTLLPVDTAPTPDTTPVIFGAWNDMILAEWGALDLMTNPYASGAYEKGNISVRMIWSVDVLIRHIESFAASTDFPAV